MIKAALDSYATSSNRTFTIDRAQTVGASEVGRCARQTYYSKTEGDRDYGAARDADHNDGWGAKLRGTIMENEFWYPAMVAAYGDKLMYAGKEQKTFVCGFLSATPDGLVTRLAPDALKSLGIADIGSSEIMAECKSADPRTNLEKPKPENVFQVQVQMGIVREMTKYQPNYSVLSYINASFWNEVVEFPIQFDPAMYEIAKQRASAIMTATDARDLAPEGWIAGGNECEYCPFTAACGVVRRSVPKDDATADPQFVAEIADMARVATGIQARVEAYETDLRRQQQAIRDRLREKGVRKIPGVVSWSSVKGRKVYDNKRIQEWAVENGLDIEQLTRIGEETDRLTITTPKAVA